MTDIVWQGDWVLVIASYCFQVASSAIASSVLWMLFIKLQPFSLENFEELSVANLFKVSYVLVQNCSVVLFMIGFLSFISKINCTALPCLFFLFHSGVAEWSFLCVEYLQNYDF